MTVNAIDQLIATRQAKLAAAERCVEDLKLEIATLSEARDAMALPVANGTPTPAKPVTDAVKTPPRRGRSLSPA
jgi:hypothetical protein